MRMKVLSSELNLHLYRDGERRNQATLSMHKSLQRTMLRMKVKYFDANH